MFYEARNDIAHGRNPTLVKLSVFARCMEVAFACRRHLATEAEAKAARVGLTRVCPFCGGLFKYKAEGQPSSHRSWKGVSGRLD